MPLYRYGAFCSILIILLVVVSSSEVVAQNGPCDPNIESLSGPNGYRPRGPEKDRCEGLIIEERSGLGTLLVSSFEEYFESFDPKLKDDVLIEWTSPEKAGETWIRAYSLRRNLFYRMDTVRPPGQSRFAWPTILMDHLNIRSKDIGLVAWIKYILDGAEERVHLPLRIRQRVAEPESKAYRLVLLPGSELHEVFISLARPRQHGKQSPYKFYGKALGYGYYPARRRIEVPIPELDAPGFYRFEISATLKGGGSTAAPPFWFYHAREMNKLGGRR